MWGVVWGVWGVWWGRVAECRAGAAGFSKSPDELFKRPDELFKGPAELFKRPDELFKRPDELFEGPDELFKRPDELFKRPGEEFISPYPDPNPPVLHSRADDEHPVIASRSQQIPAGSPPNRRRSPNRTLIEPASRSLCPDGIAVNL